ncbi:Hypothetical predicted protein [Pelobates cultripes]|uniref:Uncharacterized protein n=1 Tax=Pelobates cultripes TaxID=61616 RepID=A0AAD1X0C1_PELCU|nr:Hypothetical predicted protein [Pelobates cultripes]
MANHSTQSQVPLTAEAFLLHLAPLNLPKHSRKLIFLIVIAAQMLIARHWRSDSTPKEEELIDLITTNVAYERFATLHMSAGNSNIRMYEMWQRYRLQSPPDRRQSPPHTPQSTEIQSPTEITLLGESPLSNRCIQQQQS